jgi:signal transduction histidine kinase
MANFAPGQAATPMTAASDWVLSHFTKPSSLSRREATAVVVALVVVIGVADYASGIRVSLSLFYLVPILLATAWLGGSEAIAIVIASVLVRILGDLFAIDELPLPLWAWWNSLTALIVFLFIVWVFGRLLELSRGLEQRVAESAGELLRESETRRELQQQLLAAGSSERALVGQELHDDVCQHLVGTALAAKVLAQHLAQQANARTGEAETIVMLLEEATAKARQLARGLLLSAIEPGDLADKLSELVDEGSRSGVYCSFTCAGDVLLADAGVAAQVYRIAQEALRNAVRHADARHVVVGLVTERDTARLSVEDDGRGVGGARAASGMGLAIMQQRAAYIDATLAIETAPTGGTRVLCTVPIQRARA